MRPNSLNNTAQFHWLLLLGLGLIIYAPTLAFDFVHDDWTQVVGNYRVQSWEYFPSYFTEHVWAHLFGVEQANYYRPLFLVWTLLNHTFFGLDPLGWHLTTVLAHLLAALLFYFLALEILEHPSAAALATAIFLVHPVQVESVAWIAAVTEPLLAICIFGGLLAWIRAAQAQGRRRLLWFAAASAAYLAGLMVKESAIVMPVVVLLYELTLGQSRTRFYSSARVALVFAPAIAIYYPLRMLALEGALQASMKAPLPSVLMTLPSLLAEYLRHIVMPIGLAMNYHTPYVHAAGPRFWWPLIAILAAIAIAIFTARRSRAAAFAWLCIPVFLFLPLAASGLFAYGDLLHDRYLYLPLACVGILAGELYRSAWAAQRPKLRTAVSVVTVAVLALATVIYSQHWKNNLSIYRRSATISPQMMLPKVLVATQLIERAERAESKQLLDDARTISHDHWLVLITLAQWHHKFEQYQQAEQFWLASIAQQPRYPLHYFGLAETRIKLGRTLDAIDPLRKSVELVPSNIHYRLRLASVLQQTGDLPGALHELRQVLKQRPGEDHLRQHIARLESTIR